MKLNSHAVGEVLKLIRRPVTIDPDTSYREIGIRSFGRGIFRKEPRSGMEIGQKRVFWIEEGDLVLSNVFAWEGAVAVASEADNGFIGSHRFMTYRVKEDIAVTRFLFYYFISDAGLAVIRRASPGSAGRNKTLGIEAFANQVIDLPDVEEQRRIAAKLDAAMSRTDRIESLRKHRQRLRDALAESLISRLASAPGTPQVRIGDVMRACREPIEIDPERQYRAFGMRSFGRGAIRYSKAPGGQLSKLRYFRFPSGALSLSNIKAWEGAVGITKSEDTTCVASNRFMFYIPLDANSVDVSYLRHYLLSRDGLTKIGMCSPGSADRNRTLSIKAFESLTIPLPRIEMQRRVAKSLDELTERLKVARTDEVFAALRPSLLNAAFSGQL